MKTWLRYTLIIMSIGGGFAGVAAGLDALFKSSQPFLYRLPVFVPMAGFIYFLIGGLQFIHDPRRTTALGIGLALQVPILSSSLLTYRFASGCSFNFFIGYEEHISFNVDYSLGSSFSFILFGDRSFRIGINIVALVLLFLLGKSIATARQAQPVVAQPPEMLPPQETA